MGLHLGNDTLPRLLEPDAAVHVVGDGGDEEREQDDVEQPVHGVGVERQLEDVEAEVPTELRIGYAEADAVREKDPLLPLVGGPGADRKGEQQRHREANEPGPLPRRGVIASQHVLFGAARALGGRQPVGDRQVAVEQDEEDGDEDQRQHDPGEDHRPPDIGLGERVEPQVVGVEAGSAPQRHQHDDDGTDRKEQSPPQATGSDRSRGPTRAARRPRS